MKQQYSSYMAFLSHSRSDAAEALEIHKFIESYRIPMYVQQDPAHKRALKRLSPVFLDRSDLSAESDLTVAITRALNSSRYLIVLCSEHASKSDWVKKEVTEYLSISAVDRVIYIVSERVEANVDCKSLLPLALAGNVEPIIADRRDSGDGPRLAVLKVIAAMLKVDLTTLLRRDLAMVRRRRIVQGMILSTIGLSMGIAYFASEQGELERRQREREALAGETLALLNMAESGELVSLDNVRDLADRLLSLDSQAERTQLRQEALNVAHLLPLAERRFDNTILKLASSQHDKYLYLADETGAVFRVSGNLESSEMLLNSGGEVLDIEISLDGTVFIMRATGKIETLDWHDGALRVSSSQIGTFEQEPMSSREYALLATPSVSQQNSCVAFTARGAIHIACNESGNVLVKSTILPTHENWIVSPDKGRMALEVGNGISVYSVAGEELFSFAKGESCVIFWLDSVHILSSCSDGGSTVATVDKQLLLPAVRRDRSGGELSLPNQRVAEVELNSEIGHAVLATRGYNFDWNRKNPQVLRFLGHSDRRGTDLHVDWYFADRHYNHLWVSNWGDRKLGVFSVLDFDTQGIAQFGRTIGYFDTKNPVTELRWVGGMDGYLVVGSASKGLGVHAITVDGVHHSESIPMDYEVSDIELLGDSRNFVAFAQSKNTVNTRLGMRNSRILASDGMRSGTISMQLGTTITDHLISDENRYITADDLNRVMVWQPSHDDTDQLILPQIEGTRWGQWNRDKTMLLLIDRNNDLVIWETKRQRITRLDATAHTGVFLIKGAYWNPKKNSHFFVTDGQRVQEFLLDNHPIPALFDLRLQYAWETDDVWRHSSIVSTVGDHHSVWQNNISNAPGFEIGLTSSSTDTGNKLILRDWVSNQAVVIEELESEPDIYGISPNANYIYVLNGVELRVWSREKSTVVLHRELPFQPNLLVVSDQGSIAYAAVDGRLRLFQLENPQIQFAYQIGLEANSLSFSGGDKHLLVTSASSDARLIAIGEVRAGYAELETRSTSIFDTRTVK